MFTSREMHDHLSFVFSASLPVTDRTALRVTLAAAELATVGFGVVVHLCSTIKGAGRYGWIQTNSTNILSAVPMSSVSRLCSLRCHFQRLSFPPRSFPAPTIKV